MSRMFIKSILIAFLILNMRVYAQTFSDGGVIPSNALPPEAYTFKLNQAGSVDYHGDYSAQIPLMTVPGKKMDYPISINYKAGITTDQRASWVGLGWNLNPGGVTRVVNGLPDNVKGWTQVNLIMENGAIVEYPPLAGTTNFKFPDNDFMDYYLINIPGVVSGLVVPINLNNDSLPDYQFQEYNGFQVGFDIIGTTSQSGVYEFGTTFERLYANGGATSTTRNYKDIGFIWVRDKNGTMYVFGMPLRSEMIWYDPPVTGSNPRFIIEYVSSWQLTAIFSHDASWTYNGGNLYPDGDRGSWVRFEYAYPYNDDTVNVRNIRPLHFDRDVHGGAPDYFGLLTQTTYLSKVVTQTHEAVFYTSPRNDISFLSPKNSAVTESMGTIGDYTHCPDSKTGGTFIQPLRLDKVILYQRYPYHKLVNLASFGYAPFGQELCRYKLGAWYNIGRTTLKQISLADSAIAHFYKFQYTDSIDHFNPDHINNTMGETTLKTPIQAVENRISGPTNPKESDGVQNYYRARTGRMGYLFALQSELSGYSPSIRSTKGAAAWSLRTIEYPTGLIDTIEYENDSFNYYADKINMDILQSNIPYINNNITLNFAPDECGIRVKYISSYDSVTGQVKRTSYTYEDGHLYSYPISFLRNDDDFIGLNAISFFNYGYSSAEVEYGRMTETYNDGSKKVTQYLGNKPFTADGVYDYQKLDAPTMLTMDRSVTRSKVWWVKQYDSQNRLSQYSVKDYYFNEWPTGYYIGAPGNYMQYADPNYWSKFTGGKRLLTYTTLRVASDTTYKYELNQYGSPVTLKTYNGYTYDNYNQITGQSSYDGLGFVQKDIDYQYFYSPGRILSNRLSEVAKEKLSYKLNNKTQVYSVRRNTYRSFHSVERVDTVKIWQDTNNDSLYTDDEMKTQFIVWDYDAYGNPIKTIDANGVITHYEWSSAYKFAKLTKKTTFNGITPFTTSYTYAPSYALSTVTDENNLITNYKSNGFGQLIRVIDPLGNVIKENTYKYKNQFTTPAYWFTDTPY